MCNIWQMDHSGEATVEEFAKFMQDEAIFDQNLSFHTSTILLIFMNYCSPQQLEWKVNLLWVIYEHPLVRELYPNYIIILKETAKHSAGFTRQSNRTKKPRAKELLIMNY